MIYLQNTTDQQVVRVPANGGKVDGDVVTLEMMNTINRGAASSISMDRRVYFLDATGAYVLDSDGAYLIVGSIQDTSRLYYELQISLPDDMPEGEYEYTVRVGDSVVSCGLAIVGEPAPSVTEYDNTVQYEQYRTE